MKRQKIFSKLVKGALIVFLILFVFSAASVFATALACSFQKTGANPSSHYHQEGLYQSAHSCQTSEANLINQNNHFVFYPGNEITEQSRQDFKNEIISEGSFSLAQEKNSFLDFSFSLLFNPQLVQLSSIVKIE